MKKAVALVVCTAILVGGCTSTGSADGSRSMNDTEKGALIGALSDNNQLLTGQRLFREIATSMALRSGNAGLQQSPEYAPIQFAGHEAGEFFFMPRT